MTKLSELLVCLKKRAAAVIAALAISNPLLASTISFVDYFDIYYISNDTYTYGPANLLSPEYIHTAATTGSYELLLQSGLYTFEFKLFDVDNAFGDIYEPQFFLTSYPNEVATQWEIANYSPIFLPAGYYSARVMPFIIGSDTIEFGELGLWGSSGHLGTFVPSSEKLFYAFTFSAPEPGINLLMILGLMGLLLRGGRSRNVRN